MTDNYYCNELDYTYIIFISLPVLLIFNTVTSCYYCCKKEKIKENIYQVKQEELLQEFINENILEEKIEQIKEYFNKENQDIIKRINQINIKPQEIIKIEKIDNTKEIAEIAEIKENLNKLIKNSIYNNEMLDCNLQPIGYTNVGIEVPYYGFMNNIVPIFIRQNITNINLIIKSNEYYTMIPKDKRQIKLEYFDSRYLINFRRLKEINIKYHKDNDKYNSIDINIINKLPNLERLYLENDCNEILEITNINLKEVVLQNMKNLKELKHSKHINCHLVNCNTKQIEII